MSVTREEAITNLEKLAALFYTESEQSKMVDYSKIIETLEFAAAALRPVSREQVERVWRGKWAHTHSSDNFWTEVWKCSHCGFEDDYGECFDFCPFCGAAQTGEAVEMVMRRLEEMKNG